MKALKVIKKIDLFAFFSFAFSFFIFLLTSPNHIVSFGDSSEIIISAYKFQAAHPPGYPLFIIIGKLFTFIPIGTIPFRMSLASSLISALSVFYIYKILKIFFSSEEAENGKIAPLNAFLASQFIAFFYSLWLYAIVPEVFALNNLIAVMIIYLTLKIDPSDNKERQFPLIKMLLKKLNYINKFNDDKNLTLNNLINLCLIFLLFGLGLSNHMTIILLFPPVVFYLYINGYLKSLKPLKYIFTAFLLGLLPYIFIFLFAYLPHYPAFGNTPGIFRFINYVTRSDYGGLFSGGSKGMLNEGDHKLDIVGLYFKTLFSGYFYLPILFAVYLIYLKLFNYRSRYALLIYTTVLSGILFPIFSLYNLGGSDLHSRGVGERFGLMGFMFWGIILAIGTDLIVKKIQQELSTRGKKIANYFTPIFFLGLSLTIILTNFSRVNKKNYLLSYNYGLNILNQVNDNCVIFINDDLIGSTLLYLTQIEKIKPDIKIVSLGFLGNENYQNELKSHWPDIYDTDSTYSYDIARDIIKKNSDNGVYFSAIDDPYPYGFLGNPNFLDPQGLLIKADEKTTKEDLVSDSDINYWEKYNYEQLNDNYRDAFSQLAVYNYYFSAKINSQIYVNADCRECAEKQIDYASFFIGNRDKLTDDLSNIKKEVSENIDSASLLALAKSRFLYPEKLTEVDFHRTAWDLTRAEMTDPNNPEIEGGLGEIFEMLKVYDLSYKKYQNAARLDPFGGWEESMERVKEKL